MHHKMKRIKLKHRTKYLQINTNMTQVHMCFFVFLFFIKKVISAPTACKEKHPTPKNY